MKIHGNARTCPRSRALIVRRVEQRGWTLAETVDVKKLGRIGRPGHRVNGDRRTRTRGIGVDHQSQQAAHAA